MPAMSDEMVNAVSNRYMELYEQITGEKFVPVSEGTDPEKSIEESVLKFLGEHSLVKH